jgi:hypothetical protein
MKLVTCELHELVLHILLQFVVVAYSNVTFWFLREEE